MAPKATFTEHDQHLTEFVQQHRGIWHPDGSSCKILKATASASGEAASVEPESRSNQDRALDAIRAFCEKWFGIDHTVTWQLAHDRWQAAVRDPNDEIVAVAYGSPAGLLESLARQVRSAIR